MPYHRPILMRDRTESPSTCWLSTTSACRPENSAEITFQNFFCNTLNHEADPYFDHLRGVRVSAHFLICRTGKLTQFVSTDDRAWHAGQSLHAGRERCNNFSIGIELEGTDEDVFTDEQYDTLAKLTDALCRQYPLKDVAGHADIAPNRKTDPGPCFDWAHYETLLNSVNLETGRALRFP